MDQAAFRALLNAPRPVSADSSAPKTSKAVSAESGASKPAKQKAAAAAFKPRSTKQADAAASYRDRASERRHQDADVQAELYSKLDYESSKFVGGDLAHTHLVKGLDFALLAKLRADEEGREESSLDQALDSALPPTGEGASSGAAVPAASSAAISRAGVWARGVVAAALSARPVTAYSVQQEGSTRRLLDIDVHVDTAAAIWKAAAASSASRAAALPSDGRWAPGRTTFVFRLSAFHPPLSSVNTVSSAEAASSLNRGADGVALASKAVDVFDSDDAVPTMVIRSADDAPPAEPGLVYRLDTDVFTKVSDSVHYIRTGKRVVRKQVQKESSGTTSTELGSAAPPPAVASASSHQPTLTQSGAAASSESANAKTAEEDDDDIFGGVGKYVPPAPLPVASPGAIDAGNAAMDVAGTDIGPQLPPSSAGMDDGVIGPYPADADAGPSRPPLYPHRAHAHTQESAALVGPQPAPQADSDEQGDLSVVGPYPATDMHDAREGVTGAYPGTWDGAQDDDDVGMEGGWGRSAETAEQGAELALAHSTEEDALAEWDAVEGAGDDTAAEKARKAREDDYRRYVEGPEEIVASVGSGTGGGRPGTSMGIGANRGQQPSQAQPAARMQGGAAGIASAAEGGQEEGDEAETEELFGPTGSYLDTARAEIAALKGLGAGKAAVASGVSTSRAGSGGFSVLIADDDMAGVVTGSYTDAFAEKHASGAGSAGSKEKAGGQAAAMASIARLKAGRTGKSDVDALRQGRFDALGEGGSDRGALGPRAGTVGAVKSTWNARRFGEDEEANGGGKGGQDGRKRARMETAKLDSDLVAINKLMEQRKAQGGSAGFEAVLARGGSMPGEKKKRAGYKGDDD